jgi:hypothetical protein
MKLIAYEEGRALQLISSDEIRPLRGGPFALDVAVAIGERYRFQIVPLKTETNQSRKFENGIIVINSYSIPIISLEVYMDGILFSTRNTDESDIVLDDFMEWVISECGLRRPTTIVPRKYVSRVIIDFDHMFDAFAASFTALSETAAQAFGMDGRLCITEIQVGPFPPTQYIYQSTWQLIKRVTEPMVVNRYISSAPISTMAHLEFLERIEKAISAK